ncbi:LacI family DNA-binding transcriptional regulator [Bifidobacterium avesanii]|uniref:LacI family DNA-binding transcriptional regulator n=1 Tax=Bifidobacterium avesanii TaxID=1798157 RepID=A0A7K3TJ44_9BIFI|nr:LacI family DNA-binding transcriptional regulator [Bifidobacterium avesanii]KAB8289582.1 LacI family transcriptional regulator [Bifidobacterium avesanii]NEG79137.1 LacI family DNA-binding transcriptional regulator [Bifidobacterium avesanii]
MNRNSVTLKDVAAEAGVSMMTVSKALRDKPGVSDATRDMIRDVAARLGYEGNTSASILKTGRSNIVQVIVNEYDIPFYSRLIQSLSRAIADRGMIPFLQQTGYSPAQAESALTNTRIAGALADGVIIHASSLTGELVSSIRKGKPAVLIDSCDEHPLVSSITFPNEEGARAAVRHLADRGCRRIGIVGPPYMDKLAFMSDPTPRKLRLRGAKSALIELGLPYNESTVIPLRGMSEEYALESGHRLADDGLRFDGLFCFNDSSAIGLIRGLADRGVRVPEDVRVIGFDGVREGGFTIPSLTTITVDMDQLAQLAVMTLARQIEHTGDPLPPTRTIVGFSLTERESTR